MSLASRDIFGLDSTQIEQRFVFNNPMVVDLVVFNNGGLIMNGV